MRLQEQAVPYHIPADLHALLCDNPLEYGTGGGISEHLPCCAVWVVGDDANLVLGYAWLTEHRAETGGVELHANIAILPAHQDYGVGTFAISGLEAEASFRGAATVYCQVNSARPDRGQRVRRWLLRQGYQVLRSRSGNIPEGYRSLPDEDFALTYPGVVYLAKCLPAPLS